ncbi:MAG: hypothetical protein P1P65_02430 [Treponema sp.]
MEQHEVQLLKGIYLAPYIHLATYLRGKARHAGGNMFRHQLDTMATLVDYGYIDSVLLKAAIVHDIIEDVPGFNVNELLSIDSDAGAVYELVMEVTRRSGVSKPEYLRHIAQHGSHKAKILKCADRISNMISLGFVNKPEFIRRYCDETEQFIFPIAQEVDTAMYEEIRNLVISRRQYLDDFEFLHQHHREASL